MFGDRYEPVPAGKGRSAPNERRSRHEPGLVAHHERRQQPIVHETERQPAGRIGPTQRAAEADVTEAGQHAAQREPVITEVERHRHEDAAVGVQARPAGELRDQTPATGNAFRRCGRRWRWRRTSGPVPARSATPLAAGSSVSSSGMSPCTVDFMPGKYIEPKPPEKGRRGEPRRNQVEDRILQPALRPDDPRRLRRRTRPAAYRGGCRRCRAAAASSVRNSSRMPRPVTARARPDISQP